jgi:hypothetical protein
MLLARLEQVLLAPLSEGHHNRKEVAPHGGQVILLVGAAVRGGDYLQDAALSQRAQAVGQNVLGNTKAFLELAESGQTIEGITEIRSDHQSPITSSDLALGQ